MKKTLLLALAPLALSASAQDFAWKYVTSTDELTPGAEYVIGYNELHSKVVRPAQVMSKNTVAAGLTQLGSITEGVEYDPENKWFTAIPEDAAIVSVEPSGSGYGVKVTNAETPGYLCPVLNRNANGMSLTAEPHPMEFTWLTEDENYDQELDYGYETIRMRVLGMDADAKDLFSWTMMANFSLTYGTQYFMFLGQAAPGTLGLYKKVSLVERAGWTVSPEDGSYIEETPFTFSVSFPGATSVEINEEATNEDWIVTVNGADVRQPSVRFSGNQMMLAYSSRNPMDETGLYRFATPAGFFDVTMEDGTVLPSSAIDFTYHVGEKEPIVAQWTATPENGATVETLPMVTINWTDVKALAIVNEEAGLEVTFNGAEQQVNPSSFLQNPMVVQFMRQYPQTAGTFEINMGAGLFSLTMNDGSVVPSPELHYTVNVTGAPKEPEMKVDPANGTTLETISYMVVEFLNTSKVTKGDGLAYATLDGHDLDDPKVTIAGNYANIAFAQPIETEGLLEVIFTEGLFNMTDSKGNAVLSPEAMFSYNITGTPIAQDYTLSPAAGSYEVYPTVTVTYTDATAIELNEGAKATLKVGNQATFDFTVSAEGNVVTLTPNEEITLFNSPFTVYTLEVPENSYLLTIEGKKVANTALAITDYKVKQPTARFTYTPAEGPVTPEDLNTIVAKAVLSDVVLSTNITKKPKLYRDSDGNLMGQYIMTINGTEISMALSLYDGEEMTDGIYRVEIPADCFYTYQDSTAQRLGVAATTLTYDVSEQSGVKLISVETADEIYTPAGLRVTSDRSQLPAGLYIVNGRKVVVK